MLLLLLPLLQCLSLWPETHAGGGLVVCPDIREQREPEHIHIHHTQQLAVKGFERRGVCLSSPPLPR